MSGRISEISLSKRPGYGGPADDDYLLVLRADGTASFSGHRAFSTGKEQPPRFTEEDFRLLAAEIERLGFFTLDDVYTNHRTCQEQITITAVRDGEAKSVDCTGKAGPESLPELLAAFSGFLPPTRWELEWQE